MMAMLVRDLAWMLAVADRGHVTEAALVLRVNQPTLSRAIARVEAELGARLFDRLPDGVRLTPAGEVALVAAQQIVRRYEQLLGEVRTVTDPEAGVVRLAFLDSLATWLVPGLLQAFHAEAPRVRVELSQEPAHLIVADLESAAVDVAITSARPVGPYGWHPLQEERLVLVVPPGHRLRRRRVVGVEELGAEELITTPVGYGFRDLVDRILRDGGVAPTVSFESQDLATIEGLVAAGLGIAIVPEAFAGQSGSVGLRLRAPGAHRTIGLTWRSDRTLSPPAVHLRSFVVDRWAGADANRSVARPRDGAGYGVDGT